MYLISIIIPVYNVEQYLSRCLDSVINQTYKNLEIICIDDGSTDNSGKICDEYFLKDTRIKVIHKQNGGVSSARNAGLDIAKGDYIGFVDADDWINIDHFEYLLKLCIKHNVLLATNEYINEKHKILFNNKDILYKTEEYLLSSNFTPAVFCKLFSKNIIKNIRFIEDISMGEDGLFCTQSLSNVSFIIYACYATYHYETNSESATKKPFNQKKLTFFKAISLQQESALKNNWYKALNKFYCSEVSGAIRLLRQVIHSNFKGKEEINLLKNKLRRHLFLYLKGHYKIYNKLFALICLINFPLASWLCKKIDK